jgi:hypothetical protein
VCATAENVSKMVKKIKKKKKKKKKKKTRMYGFSPACHHT